MALASATRRAEEYCRQFLFRHTFAKTSNDKCVEVDGYEIELETVQVSINGGNFTTTSEYTRRFTTKGLFIDYDGAFEYGKDRIKVTAAMGFETPPQTIIDAVLSATSKSYNTRDEEVKRLPTTSESLLQPFKLYMLA